MRILGIESSCDETGVALYDSQRGLIANALHSQIKTHAPFGGVVPELASRDHIQNILPLTKAIFAKAKCAVQDIDGIAYTNGPGLAGALLVGAMFARTLGFACNIPSIAIHHLEGHLLSPFIKNSDALAFPLLALLVSGGHTELIYAKRLGDYELLGDTLDDAAGEAFDKIAKVMGLAYPGGADLAKLARGGSPTAFHFPRPMIDRPELNFSFSGLKTCVARTIEKYALLDQQQKADIAASVEAAIVETLVVKCHRALDQTKTRQFVVAGGVSANETLRHTLQTLCQSLNVIFHCPDLEFCTDNGAMIAYAGCQHFLSKAPEAEPLSVKILPRWELARYS